MATETSTATTLFPALSQVAASQEIIGRDASQDYLIRPGYSPGSGGGLSFGAPTSNKAQAKRKAKHDSKFDSKHDPWAGRRMDSTGLVSSKRD